MHPKLEAFSQSCREILSQSQSREALEQIKDNLEPLLTDPDFISTYLGPHNKSEREVLYEDPDQKFCILAHVYEGPKTGQPHDHGPTWAIYGQAEGETEMSEYRILTPPENGTPGRVEKIKSYILKPGMAEAYEAGQVHAPKRETGTRLVRLEGQNLAGVKREPFQTA